MRRRARRDVRRRRRITRGFALILRQVHRRRFWHIQMSRTHGPVVVCDPLKPRRRVQRVPNLTLPMLIRGNQPRPSTVLTRNPTRTLTNRINTPQTRRMIRLGQNRIVHQIMYAVKRPLRAVTRVPRPRRRRRRRRARIPRRRSHHRRRSS
jgi:hypothetical protein